MEKRPMILKLFAFVLILILYTGNAYAAEVKVWVNVPGAN